jgi:hypothetical protein
MNEQASWNFYRFHALAAFFTGLGFFIADETLNKPSG